MSRLLSSRRAISSTVAAAFMVMVIVLSFNMMLLSATYLQVPSSQLAQRNLFLRDKLAESISFVDVQVINSQLNITIYNGGGVTIHLVRLWVTNSASQWHKGFDLNYWIYSGKSLVDVGDFTGQYDPSATYVLSLVTSRGNLFQTTYSPRNTVVATVQGFGWLTVDWGSYVYTYSTNDGPDQGPYPAWCVQSRSSTEYQLYLNVINHYNKPLKLISWTYLKLQQSSGGGDQPFYIMDPLSTAQHPNDYSDYNQIQLDPNPADQQTGGPPKQVPFFAKSPGGDDQDNIVTGYYSVVIVFFYTDGVQKFGQTVPYEGTVVQGSSC